MGAFLEFGSIDGARAPVEYRWREGSSARIGDARPSHRPEIDGRKIKDRPTGINVSNFENCRPRPDIRGGVCALLDLWRLCDEPIYTGRMSHDSVVGVSEPSMRRAPSATVLGSTCWRRCSPKVARCSPTARRAPRCLR